MRRFLLLLLITCASFQASKAQTDSVKLNIPYDDTHEHIVYSLTEETELTKDQMFVNAKTWFAKTFNSYKAVVQMEDKDAGKLIAKGILDLSDASSDHKYLFSVSVEVKDKKYRVRIYDIINHITIFNSLREVPLEEWIKFDLRLKGKARVKMINYLNKEDERFRTLLLSLKHAVTTNDDF